MPLPRFFQRLLPAMQCFCLAFLFLCAGPVSAAALHSLRFDHLSIDQGIPSTGVHTLYQGRQGFIWIGTSNGLARYDGRHIRVFDSDPGDASTLTHSRVLALLEDERDQLWIGSRKGLDKLDLQTYRITRQSMPEQLKPQERLVYGLAPAGPGRLWVATAGGLFLFDMAQSRFSAWVPEQAERAFFKGEVRAMLADGKGGVWFGQDERVAHLDVDGKLSLHFSTLTAPLSAAPERTERLVRSLGLDARGRLWVGMQGGLGIWTLEHGRALALPPAAQLTLPRAPVTAILRDREQSMWLAMGEERGLYRWRSAAGGLENFVHLPAVASSLAGDSLTSLMQDSNGSVWIGTSDYGVDLVDINASGFSSYVKIPGDQRSLSHELVTAVIPDGPAHAWVGTHGGGLNRLDLASGDTERIPRATVSVNHIKSLLAEPDGRLWVGGDGLQLYDPKSRRSRSIQLGNLNPAGAVINALARSANGDVWAGSAAGLYRIAPDLKVHSFHADPTRTGMLNDEAIDSLLVDRAQRVWVGSKGALHLWDPLKQQFLQIGSVTPEISNPEKLNVTSLRQDRQGRIWLATVAGLIELQPDGPDWRLKSWRNTPGLPSDVQEAMQDAQDGAIWLSSERGLMQVQPDLKIGRYYAAQGRFDGAFNFGAAARAGDGSLLFGGVGLVRFNPASLHDNLVPPKVLLSDLLIFNRSLLPGTDAPSDQGSTQHEQDGPASLRSIGIEGELHAARRIQLNHQQNMVSFEFAALQFYRRGQNRYAWKLEGSDRDWIYGQLDQGMATYTNLNPGKYRLLAKAANPDGVWGEPAMLLEVEVLPPYWSTWWWYLGWGVFVLLALGLLYRRRMQLVRQTQLLLERQVQSRTQEVLEQKSLAESQREIAEKARHDITLLSEIGRQITASLDLQAIQQSLYRSVNELLNASSFGVGLVDWERRLILVDFMMQKGRPARPYKRSLDALDQPATQCVLHARELRIDEIKHDNCALDEYVSRASGETRALMQDGSEPELSRSGLYVPMILQGKVIGVISVLSERTCAFDQNALDILRTLAAYAAVAFDNAEAYRRLQLTQLKLAEQEKLAALGALVAGVAHELNTPIGNSLLMASTMQDMSKDFLKLVQSGKLRRSDLESFCNNSSNSTSLMLRNLTNAAGLISSFKQIAVDQTSDQRRPFDLRTVCEEVALTLSNRIKREGHELRIEIESGLLLDSYPGSLGQVLSNLIMNAMVHGLQGRTDGLISIEGRAIAEDRVELIFCDNGTGIDEAHLDRIFEPFFTTRLGQGGSGLGLHICYNIIGSILGGSISVSSSKDSGACFTIILPRSAPVNAATPDGLLA